ncbi:MAG TPA: serine/threonine-protein kinase [Labilithrix sp.]
MLSVSAGQIVADKYRIDAVVGAGGMGVVLAATHVEIGQRVAIKLLRDMSDEGLARFHREARLLVRLKSAHVARVFDVGALDDDTPYIVMELLEGSDLGKLLEEKGRFTVEEAVDHVMQAMCAVAEAHTLGMVHRDLKPANLFLAAGPGGSTVVKVLDFGVSKVIEERDRELTNEGVALGSPGYMSPEQIDSSRDVDARADVYSLGAILYRLVTGRNPYKGNSVVSVMASMAIDKMPPLRSLVPDAPEGFAVAVERALAKDRDARWPSVMNLADAIAPFGSRRARSAQGEILATMGAPRRSAPGGSTDPSLSGSAPMVFPAPAIPAPIAAKPDEAKGSGALVIGAAVLLVGAATLAYALVTRVPAPPPTDDRANATASDTATPSAIPSVSASATSTSIDTPKPHPSRIRPHPTHTQPGPLDVPPDRH